MKLAVFNNIKNTYIDKTKETKQTKQTMPIKGMLTGVGVGISVGLLDGFVTDSSHKKTINKAFDLFRLSDYSEKRKMVRKLKEKGHTVKVFKAYASNILNQSPAKLMMKNAAIYGGALGIVGLSIDSMKKHKETLNNSKQLIKS